MASRTSWSQTRYAQSGKKFHKSGSNRFSGCWGTCTADAKTQKLSGCEGGRALVKGTVLKTGRVATGKCAKCEAVEKRLAKGNKVVAPRKTTKPVVAKQTKTVKAKAKRRKAA